MPRSRWVAWTLLVALAAASPRLSLADAEADHVPDVVYGHKDGLAMTFDVLKPEKPNGAGVIYMVSGGWGSAWQPIAKSRQTQQPLLDAGFTVFVVRHGSAPRYLVPDAASDVRRAVRYIRLHAKEFGVDPERLGIYGGSAGGHLSLVIGTTADDGNPNTKDPVERTSNRVAAVAAIYAPSDLRPWVPNRPKLLESLTALDFDPSLAEGVSPLAHVSSDDAPTLLVHGGKDIVVPVSHAENIHAAFLEAKVPTELIVVPEGGHGFIGPDHDRMIEAMIKWFEKHLGEKSDE